MNLGDLIYFIERYKKTSEIPLDEAEVYLNVLTNEIVFEEPNRTIKYNLGRS